MSSSVRTLYRNLLRELPPRPILSKPRSPLHQSLRASFDSSSSSTTTPPPPPPNSTNSSSPTSTSSTSSSTTSSSSQQGTDLMTQYLSYLRAQRQYVELIERYNPGMGMDEEERVRLTARRVGMNLPKLVEDSNSKSNSNGNSNNK